MRETGRFRGRNQLRADVLTDETALDGTKLRGSNAEARGVHANLLAGYVGKSDSEWPL